MSTATITIEMENPAVLTIIKQVLRQMKGIASIKVSRKPKTKMSEAEFYQMIEDSATTERHDGRNRQHPGEGINDYLNRLLQTS